MKVNTEFNLATLPRIVKFSESNISEFWFLNFSNISHHWKILKNLWLAELKFSEFPIGEIANFKFRWKFLYTRIFCNMVYFLLKKNPSLGKKNNQNVVSKDLLARAVWALRLCQSPINQSQWLHYNIKYKTPCQFQKV